MKRTNKKVIVTLLATTAILLSMMATAFAAPSVYTFNWRPTGTTTKSYPTQQTNPGTSSTASQAKTPAASTTTSGSMSAEESKMVNLVNQDRASNGLKPLTFDAGLRAAALAHSKDMSQNNYFSHTSPTLGDFSKRLATSGVKHSAAGENIALYGSVEKAHVGLMNSSGHKANIMNANYTRIGIGIVFNQSKGAYYITQWFAK